MPTVFRKTNTVHGYRARHQSSMNSRYRTSKVGSVKNNRENSTSSQTPSIRVELQLIMLRIMGRVKGEGEIRATMVKSRNSVPASVTIVGLKGIGQGNVARRLLRKAVQKQNALGPNSMIQMLMEDELSVVWQTVLPRRQHKVNHVIPSAVWHIPSTRRKIPQSDGILDVGSRIVEPPTT